MTAKPIHSLYDLRVAGKHVRWASMVTFPGGDQIRFIDRMGAREAIRQANAQLIIRLAEQVLDQPEPRHES